MASQGAQPFSIFILVMTQLKDTKNGLAECRWNILSQSGSPLSTSPPVSS